MTELKKQKCFNCNKIGIVQCDGCIHRFCLKHYSEHRHQLDELFQQIIDEQIVLFDKIKHPYTLSPSIHLKLNSLTKEINEWEQRTLKIVKNTADRARQKINELILPDNKMIEDKLDELSQELQQRKVDNDYFEQDIERLSIKLKQIQKDMKVEPSQIQIVKKFIDWSKVLRFTTETSSNNLYP